MKSDIFLISRFTCTCAKKTKMILRQNDLLFDSELSHSRDNSVVKSHTRVSVKLIKLKINLKNLWNKRNCLWRHMIVIMTSH